MSWIAPPNVIGNYNAFYICLSLPKTNVQQMLPDGISLGAQNLTPSDHHPIYLIFGHQTDVTFKWHALKGPGFKYKEFAFGIPFTVDETSGNGPFFFMPRLYLDRWLPILIGMFWGFAKAPARFDISAESYAINSYQNSKLIHGEFKSLGEPAHLQKYPQLRSIVAPFGQKAIA
ncbi:MAG: hypothetical protein AAF902_23550, partial [Chloroflexota bacterium]